MDKRQIINDLLDCGESEFRDMLKTIIILRKLRYCDKGVLLAAAEKLKSLATHNP